MTAKKKEGLELLREPFKPNQIGKLPKPTKKQTDEVKANFKAGERCKICGGWHHPKVIHLDYVGHAALTDRLLDCDPNWTWEPFSVDEQGQPVMVGGSGMWIKLTVCGVTRIGYGDAGNKKGGDAIKEVIGDGLRNAAMRFGAALDLWHKGDLHVDEVDDTPPPTKEKTPAKEEPPKKHPKQGDIDGWIAAWVIAKKAGADPKAWWEEKRNGIFKDCGGKSGADLVNLEMKK